MHTLTQILERTNDVQELSKVIERHTTAKVPNLLHNFHNTNPLQLWNSVSHFILFRLIRQSNIFLFPKLTCLPARRPSIYSQKRAPRDTQFVLQSSIQGCLSLQVSWGTPD